MTPYLPSNGTEGEQFHKEFCYRCARAGPENGPGCPIWAKAVCGDQPAEWIEDETGPRCTAFTTTPPATTILECSICGTSSEEIPGRLLAVHVCRSGRPHRWRRARPKKH